MAGGDANGVFKGEIMIPVPPSMLEDAAAYCEYAERTNTVAEFIVQAAFVSALAVGGVVALLYWMEPCKGGALC